MRHLVTRIERPAARRSEKAEGDEDEEAVEEAAEADMIMSVLMGDDVESRRNFITTNARDVRNLDF